MAEGFIYAISFQNIIIGLTGTAIGIVIGALPGLGASIAMTLALPLTFKWSPDSAIILLMALYCGATYGGSISAILINTPGTPASGATGFDGFPMARQGKGDIALGLSVMSSFIGGIVGAVLLFTVTPLIARAVLMFGPAEFFLIAIFSLTIIGAMGEDKLLKGLISCGFGLCLGFIGADVMTGFKRFSYGSRYLMGGLSSVVVLIGIFAISEMISLMERGESSISETENPGTLRGVLKGCALTLRYPVTLIRSALIGSGVGAMPALGVTTASFLSYMFAMNSSRHPETFGEGDPEGVVAPECANNAVTATALMPTLTLGIPGSTVMAIILGALTIQGIVPGPDLFRINAQYMYAVMWALFFINTYMLIIGVLGSGAISRITNVPTSILAPGVIVLCTVGAFALNKLWQDIICAIIFGFIGYVIKKFKYSSLGLILGLILGPIAETSFHQALRISGGDYSIFISSFISKILVVCIVLSVAYPIYKSIRKRKMQKAL
jgi:putative tricarboxylic transport membrane protein